MHQGTKTNGTIKFYETAEKPDPRDIEVVNAEFRRQGEQERLADEAVRQGDLAQAARILEEALEGAPKFSQGGYFSFIPPKLARLYIDMDRPADAVKTLVNNESGRVNDCYYPLLCIAYCHLRDREGARTTLKGSLPCYFNIGGEEAESLNAPRPQTLAQHEAAAWAALCYDKFPTQEGEEAYRCSSKAFALWPDQPLISLYHARSSFRLGHYQEAKEAILKTQANAKGSMKAAIGDWVDRMVGAADWQPPK
ncbi:MAG: tetratricopeptide repeat protein [Fimbriimonadaceae bacterium]|nr:tetratricopeptide repeat protein [Fimbriimonadaceae bacterium]QYK55430.1 MAG: tetratricopeptide repeat protein [Fimbriimonadaceae bacterium]